MTKNWQISFASTIAEIDRTQWQYLVGQDNPFVSYDYLHALEKTGAAGAGTAWQPQHVIAHTKDSTLLGAVPLYAKEDSWGEFVFDFSWANAYHQHGIPYYPKLVTAVPYTPVTGPRLLLAAEAPRSLRPALLQAIKNKARDDGASSWHMLFPDKPSLDDLGDDVALRKDCQFHWQNKGYRDFDHYLETFRSSNRKKTRRERRKIVEADVEIRTFRGRDLTPDQWSQYFELYASTFYKRGRDPYLAKQFFTLLAKSDQIDIMTKWAYRNEQPIAVSLFFVTANTLYGRYWGTREFVDGLHFELCYHQGIEYCIENDIALFDPGVQGEHKIARGFESATTWSAHWLRHPQFAAAIGDYVKREAEHIDDYMSQVDAHTPFRQSDKDAK